jgi:hypothetical protein
MSFGLMLIGGSPGKAWIDDVELETVGTEEPVTASGAAPAGNVRQIPKRPVNLGLEL